MRPPALGREVAHAARVPNRAPGPWPLACGQGRRVRGRWSRPRSPPGGSFTGVVDGIRSRPAGRAVGWVARRRCASAPTIATDCRASLRPLLHRPERASTQCPVGHGERTAVPLSRCAFDRRVRDLAPVFSVPSAFTGCPSPREHPLALRECHIRRTECQQALAVKVRPTLRSAVSPRALGRRVDSPRYASDASAGERV